MIVVETLAAGNRVAAQVRVDSRATRRSGAPGYYTVADSVITDGVEHWGNADSQPAPEWRNRFSA